MYKSDMQYTDDDDEMRDMQCTDDDDEMRGGECMHDCIQEERVRGRAGCGFDARFHSNFECYTFEVWSYETTHLDKPALLEFEQCGSQEQI